VQIKTKISIDRYGTYVFVVGNAKGFSTLNYEVSQKDVWDWERKNIVLGIMQMDGGIDNKTF